MPEPHAIEVRAGAARREMKRRIEPGARVYRVRGSAVQPETGGLSVASRPPGARVSVDGQPRGVTPVVIDVLSVGRAQVTVTNGVSTADESIDVQPGVTASIVVPLAASAGRRPGWMSVPSAMALQIFENGTLGSLDLRWRADHGPRRAVTHSNSGTRRSASG